MTTVPSATIMRNLLDLRLDGNLDGLVTGLRLGGWSWRRIATEVERRTGVAVSHESLRAWYGEAPKAGAA